MSRPLMQYGVGQLLEIFAKSKTDQKLLKQLEDELKYRQVPRAVALLTEVQAAMYTAVSPATVTELPTAQPAMNTSKQPELFEHSEALSTHGSQQAVVIQSQPVAVPNLPRKSPALTTMTISIGDAYKLLKATPGSTWESIEKTRQFLVQQAHPSRVAALSSEKRAQAEAEARQANAAYIMLSNTRRGS